MAVCVSVIATSVCGVVLLGILAWKYLGYEYIPNLVSIDQAASMQFDYIIVGAGTVGSVLANRLSANANISVLLIEAGGHFGPISTVPLLALALQKTHVDWAYVSTSQKHSSRGLVDNKQFLPRGKGLGGSNQMNYLLHSLGLNADFDAWERAGARGWGSATMRRYVEQIDCRNGDPMRAAALWMADKSSDCQVDQCSAASAAIDPEDDPQPKLYTTNFPVTESMLADVFDAVKTQHLRHNHPYVTFSTTKSTTFKGARWSNYHSYLRPTFQRPNLHILINARVRRIQFDALRRATSVLISDDAQSALPQPTHEIRIKSTGEIILSAGAYGTPHLLMLSGVGPVEQLDLFKIARVATSPLVGRNLHDHVTVPLFVSINESLSMTTDKLFRLGEVMQYVTHGIGYYSRFGVVGFVTDEREHHSFGVFGAGTMEEQVLRDVANCKQDVFRTQFPLYENTSQEGFVFLNTCHQPKSRGTVKLTSRQSRAPPAINPNYLADPADVRCIIRAMRLAVESVHCAPLRRIGAKIHWPRLSGCVNFGPFEEDLVSDWPNDRYLECLIRHYGVSSHHPAGTCAMGSGADSCADPELRVRGVTGVRVADASVIPSPISGTTNTVLTAVGERAADLILADYIVGKSSEE